MKFVLIVIADTYIGWNGAGRWKLSLFETLFLCLLVSNIVYF